MTRLLEILRSLGPSGAVANARELLDERRREDRLVRSVAMRLAPATTSRTRAA